MATDPRDRFTSADEMCQSLRAAGRRIRPGATAPRLHDARSRPPPRSPPVGPTPGARHRHPHRAAPGAPTGPARPGPPAPRSSSPPSLVLALAVTLFVVLLEWHPTDGAGRVRGEAPRADPGADTTGSASRLTPRARPSRRSPLRSPTEGCPETARWRAPCRRRRHKRPDRLGRPRRSRHSPSPASCSTAAASPRGSIRTS